LNDATDYKSNNMLNSETISALVNGEDKKKMMKIKKKKKKKKKKSKA
jgi:hypothetical protein